MLKGEVVGNEVPEVVGELLVGGQGVLVHLRKDFRF